MIRYVRAYQTANGRNSTFTMTTVSKPKKLAEMIVQVKAQIKAEKEKMTG